MSMNTLVPEYDYSAAANYCGPHITERQLRRAVASGKLSSTRPGLKTLFTQAQLDAYLAASVRSAGAR